MYDEEEIQTGRKCNSQNLHCSWSIRMHTSQYWLLRLWTANNKKHFHGEVLSETVFGKNSAQLLEPVSAYQETEPPRKTKQKTKHRHTKKAKPQVYGHTKESCLQTYFSTRPGDHFTGLKES